MVPAGCGLILEVLAIVLYMDLGLTLFMLTSVKVPVKWLVCLRGSYIYWSLERLLGASV